MEGGGGGGRWKWWWLDERVRECERKREGPSDTPPPVRPPLVPSRRRLGRGHKYPSSPPPPTSHSSPSSTSPPTLAALAVLGHVFAHHWSWPQTLGARKQFRQELADPGAPPAVPSSLSPSAAASRPTTLDPIILRGRRQRRREEEEQEGGRKYFKRDFFFPNSTFSPSSDLVRPFVQAREGRGKK